MLLGVTNLNSDGDTAIFAMAFPQSRSWSVQVRTSIQPVKQVGVKLNAKGRAPQCITPMMTVFAQNNHPIECRASCCVNQSQDHGYVTRDMSHHQYHSQNHGRSCLVHMVTTTTQQRSSSSLCPFPDFGTITEMQHIYKIQCDFHENTKRVTF